MEKTAKQLVYDAINFLRNKMSGIALSPIQDGDDVFETYGFTRKDVCKLCEMIAMDADMEVPHQTIHQVSKVSDIIVALQNIIDDKDVTKNYLQLLGIFTNLLDVGKELNKIMNNIAIFEALSNQTGLNKGAILKAAEGTNETSKALKVILEGFDVTTVEDAGRFCESLDVPKLIKEIRQVQIKYRDMYGN